MRLIVYMASAAAVMLLAVWAYHENYRTQAALDEVTALQNDIARLTEELEVLRDEWAYLNRPERLRELAEINFDRLGLMPLRAEQFGRVDEVAFPVTPIGPVTDPIDVVGSLEDMQ